MIQGWYTFQVLSVWEFAELLPMRNISTAKVKVHFSLVPFAFVEKLCISGGKLGRQLCCTTET